MSATSREPRMGKAAAQKPGGRQGAAPRDPRSGTIFGLAWRRAVTFWFIVMATGCTLHAHGITTIADAGEAADALEPLAGTFARLLFALGIVGTGLLAVPVLAGSAAYGIAEAFGWREGFGRRSTTRAASTR